MKYLHAWAHGRRIISVITPQLIAVCAPECLGLLQMLREGSVVRAVKKIPPLDQWLPLYRNPHQVERVMFHTFRPSGDPQHPHAVSTWFHGRLRAGVAGGMQVEDAIIHVGTLTPRERLAAKTGIEQMLRYMYWEHYRDLAAHFQGYEIEDGVDLDAAFATREVLFYILVWLPCALEYGERAGDLYAKSIQGDRMALDKLLRIDKSLLWDPQVAKTARKLGMERREYDTAIIAEAFQRAPARKLDARSINVLLAGLISRITQDIGCKLDPMEIRDLFDAVAKDRSGDPTAIETELPESPEALKQAIFRAKPFWNFLKDRNKTDLPTCPEDLGWMAVVSDVDESTPRPTWIDGQIALEAKAKAPPDRRAYSLLGWSGRLFHRVFGS
jgi:hypothetical protein